MELTELVSAVVAAVLAVITYFFGKKMQRRNDNR